MIERESRLGEDAVCTSKEDRIAVEINVKEDHGKGNHVNLASCLNWNYWTN
jgi:hypothetical protein